VRGAVSTSFPNQSRTECLILVHVTQDFFEGSRHSTSAIAAQSHVAYATTMDTEQSQTKSISDEDMSRIGRVLGIAFAVRYLLLPIVKVVFLLLLILVLIVLVLVFVP